MSFFIKSVVGNPLKGMGVGRGEEKADQETSTDPAAAVGMTREECEDYQRQLVEEKIQRDADFLHKKAERATLRVCLREKYRLPKSEQDENMIQMAGDDVDIPEELLKMVEEDATEEEEKDSILGHLQNLQNMDIEQMREKASATLTEMKSKAEERCSVM
ncbi:hypothetical protein P4O66_016933 [Electrophorus voltai]|uniref:Complexin 4b n=2 Tax=Electrophorus TaxID=8004 RepID=A0A4W4ECJ0_ELEEL|nr:complexin-4a [Electrophorus electricus]KAK1788510.1 hypothetical protein P4O66_016933 [Electrophorus voltai]